MRKDGGLAIGKIPVVVLAGFLVGEIGDNLTAGVVGNESADGLVVELDAEGGAWMQHAGALEVPEEEPAGIKGTEECGRHIG
jgi:hypothetical protein